MKNKEVQQIKFKYLFEKSYNPVYCTGAFGGSTPKNEIILNFFMERHPIPYSETITVKEDGSLGDIIDNEPRVDSSTINVIRNVQTGVIMNIETAKEIYTWLGDNISIIENKEKGN